MNEKDLLQEALMRGIVDVTAIEALVYDMRKKEALEKHQEKVWLASDGRWKTYEVIDGKRRLIARTTKEALEKEITRIETDKMKSPTFKQCFDMWIQKKLQFKEIQKATYDRYMADYKRYLRGKELARTRVRNITEYDLEEFIKTTICDLHLSARAWGNMRIIINGTMIFARKNGWSDIHMGSFLEELQLSPKIFTHKRKLDEEQIFDHKEEKRIVKYLNDNKDIINLGVALAFETGLRVGELCSLKHCDINGETLTVERTEIKYIGEHGERVVDVRQDTKGRDGIREVVLSTKAQEYLKEIRKLNPFGEYLFMRDGERIIAVRFQERIRKVCEACQLSPKSFHKIRKTYGTKLLQNGVEDKIIEKQMGHTDVLTTKRFYYYNNNQVEEIKKVLDSI